MKRNLTIAARVLAVAAIAFIASFALDSFGPGRPLPQAVVAFIVHLVPAYVLVGILILAWIWPMAGGVLFLVVSIVPFLLLDGNPLWVNALLGVPFALVGALFLLADWFGRRPDA